MKNTHCCQCGKPRGIAPISHGFSLDRMGISGIFTPCPGHLVDRNPAPGVHLEQHPSLLIAAAVWRNGGTSDDVHICVDCTTKAVRHIRDQLSSALGDLPNSEIDSRGLPPDRLSQPKSAAP